MSSLEITVERRHVQLLDGWTNRSFLAALLFACVLNSPLLNTPDKRTCGERRCGSGSFYLGGLVLAVAFDRVRSSIETRRRWCPAGERVLGSCCVARLDARESRFRRRKRS